MVLCMRVLLVDSYDADHPGEATVETAVAALEANGNQIDHLRLAPWSADQFMSADEWRAYETDEPIISDDVRAAAAQIKAADALLFCYPTTLFGVPPQLKAWLERVMVPGVAFVFDDKQRLRPGMYNVRRLGAVTTTPHTDRATWKARDLGHRTIMRTLRLNCNPRCRRSFVRLLADDSAADATTQIQRALRSWC